MGGARHKIQRLQGWICGVPRVDRSVTLFGALPPNRAQIMTLTHRGASKLAKLIEGNRWRLDPGDRAPWLPGPAGG
jgi:hypothetical protein